MHGWLHVAVALSQWPHPMPTKSQCSEYVPLSCMQRVTGLPLRLPQLEMPPPTGSRENRDPALLRCFVRRELGGERAVAKFQLYLGSEHNEPDSSKFLMAALLTSRCT